MRFRNYIYTLGFIIAAGSIFAQGPGRERGKMRDQLESNRIAFFTQFLRLTSEQAKSFWPIYNEMRDSEQKLRSEFKIPIDIDSMNDEEVSTYLDEWKTQEQTILDNRSKYIAEIRTVITDRQVVRMLNAERMFKERLLKRLRKP